MEATIINAIIASCGVVGGGVASTLVKNYLDNKDFWSIDSHRRKSLSGAWKGVVDQLDDDNGHKTHKLELNLSASHKKITGTGNVYSMERVYSITIRAVFRNSRFLKLDYENSKKEIIQFGSIVLELSPSSEILNGKFVGYGHLVGDVIYGSVSITKEKVS